MADTAIHEPELAVPEIPEADKHKAEERVAISAPVLHEAIRLQGERELERPASALAWSGFAAGLSMGFSLIAEGLIATYVPEAGWKTLLVRLGYPLGFLIVILCRQQLFTENTLTAIIPLLAKRDLNTLFRVLKLWVVVLVSNLAGAHLLAWVLARTPMFEPNVQRRFLELGLEARRSGSEPRCYGGFSRAGSSPWWSGCLHRLNPSESGSS